MVAKLAIKLHLDPSGLKNKGNTCFFNSSIQCLLSLPKVVRYFLENSFDSSKQPFCIAFQNFIFDYKNNKILDPTEFLSKIRGKIKLFDGKQQDAHAFLESFITRLSDELDSLETTKSTNIIKKSLAITLEDHVKCQNCAFISITSTTPLIQYLFIKESVQKSVNYFTDNDEWVDEDLPWKCTKCGSKTTCSISHSIKSTSDYFIVYLNRFQSPTHKNNTQILLEQKININDSVFELIGMTCHSGVLSGGHYFAFCKRDKWVELNDSLVQGIEEPEHYSSSAYILFYSKIQ